MSSVFWNNKLQTLRRKQPLNQLQASTLNFKIIYDSHADFPKVLVLVDNAGRIPEEKIWKIVIDCNTPVHQTDTSGLINLLQNNAGMLKEIIHR